MTSVSGEGGARDHAQNDNRHGKSPLWKPCAFLQRASNNVRRDDCQAARPGGGNRVQRKCCRVCLLPTLSVHLNFMTIVTCDGCHQTECKTQSVSCSVFDANLRSVEGMPPFRKGLAQAMQRGAVDDRHQQNMTRLT